jgi:hypothetical protein
VRKGEIGFVQLATANCFIKIHTENRIGHFRGDTACAD